MIKIGINGLGRIGRRIIRLALKDEALQLTHINDLMPIETLCHLLKYDSVHGRLDVPVSVINKDTLAINGSMVSYSQEKNPSDIPWNHEDYIFEATGLFKTQEEASNHIRTKNQRVIITAPSTDKTKTIVLGVNDHLLDSDDKVVSNASCTTNSAAPLLEVLTHHFKIESCYITTVHSYTTDQRIQDAPHKDLRRSRAAAQNIIPTTTGAAKALTKIFPEIPIGGCGIRVPVADGSLTDLSLVINDTPSPNQINEIIANAASNNMNKIIAYTEDPIVSTDVIGCKASVLFDSKLTSTVGNMVKILGWYDNETGYSQRLIDLAKLWHKKRGL